MPSDAVDHWKRTGVILPDHGDDVAAWIAENNGGDR